MVNVYLLVLTVHYSLIMECSNFYVLSSYSSLLSDIRSGQCLRASSYSSLQSYYGVFNVYVLSSYSSLQSDIRSGQCLRASSYSSLQSYYGVVNVYVLVLTVHYSLT